MMDELENIESEAGPEIDPEIGTTVVPVVSDNPVAPDPTARRRKRRFRPRSAFFALLLMLYLITNVIFAYMYWTRPVRKQQFINAYDKFYEYAEIYNVPVPGDNKYGFDNE